MSTRSSGTRSPRVLAMNDIAHVALALAQPLFVDSYELNRATAPLS